MFDKLNKSERVEIIEVGLNTTPKDIFDYLAGKGGGYFVKYFIGESVRFALFKDEYTKNQIVNAALRMYANENYTNSVYGLIGMLESFGDMQCKFSLDGLKQRRINFGVQLACKDPATMGVDSLNNVIATSIDKNKSGYVTARLYKSNPEIDVARIGMQMFQKYAS